ncbi:MAG: 2-isopropylmalate synthase [Armatimonadota bacterium]|nr:2-isopropylmalate synthase [Armatimonadota bacterium]MCX7778335.1 2-isopropylmalate synthase [Armatimonadota bacterium]MDW8026413.1 2-isopropylmalate synthase [Armatimonadota bacterium]
MKERRIIVFDTTLRDGEQSPGVSLSESEKLEIAIQLARLGVDVIEAGFPVASKGELEAVKRIAKEVKGPVIAALARASEEDINAAAEALSPAERKRIHTFIATSDIHMQYKLKKSRDEVIEMTREAVSYARKFTDDVEFSAEDATRSDPDFLCKVFEVAIDAGATTINIPDTVGYALPHEYGELVRTVMNKVPNIDRAVVSVHCHDDLGMAVANSIAGIIAGASQVECTINGIGERAGNASLEEIVAIIYCRQKVLNCYTSINTELISRTSNLVSILTGMPVQPNKAVVGANAFKHESGIHQHGMLSNPLTYSILDPKLFGVTEEVIVLGKHSGRHALEMRLQKLGYELNKGQLDQVFKRFKELAEKKREVTDMDLAALVSDVLHTAPEIYQLDYMHVVSGKGTVPSATVRIQFGDEILLATGTGVGPIDALYKTIDKLITIPHRLVDFSVRSVGPGTDAVAEVFVRIADEEGNLFGGYGISTDTIEAAAKAYMHALNKLAHSKAQQKSKPNQLAVGSCAGA